MSDKQQSRFTRPVRIINGCVFGLSPVDAIPWIEEIAPTPLDHALRVIVQRLEEVDDENES